VTTSRAGESIYEFAKALFPLCRSITGQGVRNTLAIIQGEIPELEITEVPSGSQCFDWEIPNEWNINDAWIETPGGEKIAWFKRNNLHLVGYSEPIDAEFSLEELQPHLFSIPEQPNAIPYVTSYFKRFWGFCLPHRDRSSMERGTYRVHIDSTLAPGSLTYAEAVIPGTTSDEIFLSTYICHPSMGNNEVSGPALTTFLVNWIKQQPRRFTYRVVYAPETIGAIAYLSRNYRHLKEKVHAAFEITCVGDDRTYSFLPSRLGNTVADRVALHVLRNTVNEFKHYSFLDRGSDERQYCSPGIDLPMVSLMRSKYGEYPEYHTSLDNLDFISPNGFQGSFQLYADSLEALEANHRYHTTCLGEPQLGRRGLRPNLGLRTTASQVKNLSNVMAYSDGNHDLLQIADMLQVSIFDLVPIVQKLTEAGLLKIRAVENSQ
jgi:aminopeptidase-like protein